VTRLTMYSDSEDESVSQVDRISGKDCHFVIKRSHKSFNVTLG
jgi:hypothetical protein